MVAAYSSKKTEKTLIRDDASRGNSEDMREQHDAVPNNRALGGERRRVIPDEERDRAEAGQNDRCDRETHQNREGCLFEGKTGTKQLREHSVDDRVAAAGK